MNNDMRKEFEDYVKKLTTAICKDIFLEKLEELYQKYKEEYERYSEASSIVQVAGKELNNGIKDTEKLVKDISINTNQSIKEINTNIASVEANTKKLFSEMKVFNDKKAEEFIIGLANYIEGYKKEISTVFEESEKKISDKLAGVITPEIMREFLYNLQESTAETKKMVEFINEGYKTEVESSIRNIVQVNSKAMEDTDMKISKYVKKMTNDLLISQQEVTNSLEQKVKGFEDYTSKYMAAVAQYFGKLAQTEKENRDLAIEEQKKLIEQIGPDNKKMELLEQKVLRVERAVHELEREQEIYNEKLVGMLEQLSEEQKKFENQQKKELIELKNSLQRSNGNAMILLVFVLYVVFEVFGLLGVVIAIMIVVTACFVSPKFKWQIKKLFRNR